MLWNTYDFDSQYAIEYFIFQLEKIADFLESPKAKTLGANNRAKKIRTTVKLLKRVHVDEYYRMQWGDIIESKYGKMAFAFKPIEGTDYSEFLRTFDGREYSKEEMEAIDEETSLEMRKSEQQHQKAKRIAWKMVGSYVDHWWC